MINTAYFLGILFIFIRITSFFFAVKVFFPTGTPKIMKIFLGMILSYGAITGVDYSLVVDINSNYVIAYMIINEIICGLLLGFIVNLIFDVFKMAGAFMDAQAGLSMLNILDPSTKSNATLMANLSYTISMVIFFVSDGHHLVIKCIIESFNIVPIGIDISISNSFNVLLDIFIKYFVIGVKIAIPMVLIIIMTDICMGLISRTVPALNVMVLGMPVKLLLGLITFVAILPMLVKTMVSAMNYIPDMLEKILKVLSSVPLVLIFSQGDDKTEEATPKKKQDARKKGQLARSKDVGIACTMVACILVIIVFSSFIVNTIIKTMTFYFESGILTTIDENSIKSITVSVLLKIGICILPVALPIMIAGVAASLMQTGFLLTGEPLKPSFSKLNPLAGFKNMFSKKSLVDLIKNLSVVSIIGFLGYIFIVNNYEEILQTSNLYLPSLGEEIKSLIVGMFFPVSLVLIIIAATDYVVQYRFHKKELRMSKQEIKEEYKQMEGDPQVKSKIKQKQREMASRRMMQQVADATVVVTNPTHISVAIMYKDGETEAPKVVAKGADLIALKIKEVAKENNVPIMENKPLARMLYEKVDLDKEIPQDMYQAVAEILAMVYKIKK